MTVFDTITITKTITVVLRQAQEPNEPDDTLRVSTVTERDHVRDRSQLRVKSEKLKVETDTVYIEREADKTVAAVGPNTEIDKDGNVTKRVNRFAQSLKWLCFTLIAVIILIIIIKLKIIK